MSKILPFIILFVITYQTEGCNKTYRVSAASHHLSQYSNLEMGIDSSLLKDLPEEFKNALVWALPHAIVLIIVGIIMFIIAIAFTIGQFVKNLFSSPNERYWEWSIRATKSFMVLAAFIISMLAGAGLFNVYNFYSDVTDPFIGFQQVVSEKYRLMESVANTVNSTSQKYSVSIPASAMYAFTYVKNLGEFHSNLLQIGQKVSEYSAYANFLVALGFVIIVTACIMAILFSLTQHRLVPNGVIILILLATLLIWFFAAISGTLSLVMARECNKGIDSVVTPFLYENGTTEKELSECVRAGINHYLFCAPWDDPRVSTKNPCPDPTVTLIDLCKHFITELDHKIPDLEAKLYSVINELTEINSCNISVALYSESKETLCWNLTNSGIAITALYIIQSPILLVLLIYVFFGWHRFSLRHVPFDDNEYITINQSDREEELVLLKNEIESDSEEFVPELDRMAQIKNFLKAEYLQLREKCKRDIRMVIFSAGLFLVVFLMIFVWLALQTSWETVYGTRC